MLSDRHWDRIKNSFGQEQFDVAAPVCLQTQSPEGTGLDAGELGGGGTRQGRGDESQEEAGTRHQRARGRTRHSQPRTRRRREEHQEVPTTDQGTTTTG